ncbi:MAG: thymidine phosphorylase, partial [Thermoanaerobaculia bacterium]
DGFVTEVAPRTIGYGIISLGGGRRTIEDVIDPGVGFVIDVKPGDKIHRGDVLATVHAKDSKGLDTGLDVLREAITIGDEPGTCLKLVSLRVTAEKSTEWFRPE